MNENLETPRPPLPFFNDVTAQQKVRLAEDGWNSRDALRVSLAYTPDSVWRNRAEFLQGRAEIEQFLIGKWNRELDYRLTKELWAFHENRIAVRFAYEWHDETGDWYRSYGNENWEFDPTGYMKRHMVIRIGFTSDVAFSPAVKSIQHQRGSRDAYGRMERGNSWPAAITPELKEFVESQTNVFLATASADGQPYIQHRGATAGYLQVLDDRTIAFFNFAGNRQFISIGNLSENPKAHLFLIDFAQQRRIKIWGEASIVETTSELAKGMVGNESMPSAEEVILFRVITWNEDCRKYIPRRFNVADVARALTKRDQRIVELKTELKFLRSAEVG